MNGAYDVKLIDLDRSSSLRTRDMGGYVGEMYRKSQRGWTTNKFDWKQLGLLAARIVTRYKMTDEGIVSSDLVSQDQCLRELIKEGETSIILQYTIIINYYCSGKFSNGANFRIFRMHTLWLCTGILQRLRTAFPTLVAIYHHQLLALSRILRSK